MFEFDCVNEIVLEDGITGELPLLIATARERLKGLFNVFEFN